MPLDEAEIHRAVLGWSTASSTPHTLPAGDAPDWQAAKQAVVVHGIGALLGARHGGPGASFPDAPDWFRAFLVEQATCTAARVGRLLSEAYTLRAAADRAGIDLVALKGVALSQVPGFPMESRPLNDIDLLVREAQRPAFEQVLREHGYALSEASPRHREYICQRFNTSVVYRDGDHPDNPVKLELHTWVGQELLSARRIAITESMWEARETQRGVALHLLLHTGANAAKRRLRQVHLLDLALLVPQLDAEDTAWIAQTAIEADAAPLLHSALRLAERFAALPEIPAPLAALRTACGDELLHALDRHDLRAFSMAGPPLDLAWELQWLPRGEARWIWYLRRAVPLHRLWLDPVRLRERYHLPLDAPAVQAYAIHAVRAALWPLILLARFIKGIS